MPVPVIEIDARPVDSTEPPLKQMPLLPTQTMLVDPVTGFAVPCRVIEPLCAVTVAPLNKNPQSLPPPELGPCPMIVIRRSRWRLWCRAG